MKKNLMRIVFTLNAITGTHVRRTGAMVLAAAMLGAGAYAQTTSGDIVGTITDPTGALVPNAQVTATNTQTNVKYPTNANGNGEYRISNVPAGTYDVTATATGFTTQTQRGFEVQLNKQGTLIIHLQPAGASTTVEVSAAAAVALDTTTVQLQQSFSNNEVSTLPTATNGLLGVLNLSLLSPNVATQGGIGAGSGPAVGGQRPRANNFTIEGIDNNDKAVTGPLIYVPNDSVGEFTLITNQFSPEFGHSTGGQFNTTVLSGTNSFHGRAWEYFQNRNLNAIDQSVARGFAPGTKPFNPRFDDNRFGGQLGGPIKRDRLFFFGSYERNPIGQAASYPVCTPTAAGLTAIANASGLNANNVAFVEKYVPAAPAQISTAADQVCGNKTAYSGVPGAKGIPLVGPDQYSLIYDASHTPIKVPLGNFQVNGATFSNFQALSTSGDWTISQTDSFRLRYLYNSLANLDTPLLGGSGSPLPAFWQPIPTKTHLVALSEFHNFSPNVTNEARAGFTRNAFNIVSGNFTYPGLDSFPNITPIDFGALNIGPDGNAPQFTIQNLYQFTDNVSWVKGNHTIKIGFDGRKYISPQGFTQRARGDYQYTFLGEFLQDVAPTFFGERSGGNTTYYGDQTALYGYGNDTWRVRPNLTINYGLRYEFTSVPTGERLQALNSAASVPGLITFNKPTPQYKNFAPRLGIDYAPNDKTSIRAGFGMAYDVIYDNLGTLSFPPQLGATEDVGSPGFPAPGAPNFLANGGLPPGKGGLNTFPTIAAQRAATFSLVPNQKLPYSETYSFGIQHVFGQNYTAEVRYVGTRGIHLPTQNQLNVMPIVTPTNSLPTDLTGTVFTSTSTLTLTQVTAGNGQKIDNGDGTFTNAANLVPAYFNAGFFTKVVAFEPFAESNYNSLASSLIRRFRNGLQLDFAYTWSKTMDDATADVFSTLLTPRRPFNSQNVAADYSRSALDRTHRLTLEAIYDVPFYKGNSNWLLKNIVSNWEVAPIYTYQSPEYATVESGVNTNLNGDSPVTSRVVINPNGNKNLGSDVAATVNPALQGACDPTKDPTNAQGFLVCSGDTVGYYALNPSAYYIAGGRGALANSGRNTLPLPPTNDVDATAIKRFNFTERYALEFQVQAFNVFNHPQFISGSINTVKNVSDTASSTQSFLNASNSLFNQPKKAFASNSRALQLAAKFSF